MSGRPRCVVRRPRGCDARHGACARCGRRRPGSGRSFRRPATAPRLTRERSVAAVPRRPMRRRDRGRPARCRASATCFSRRRNSTVCGAFACREGRDGGALRGLRPGGQPRDRAPLSRQPRGLAPRRAHPANVPPDERRLPEPAGRPSSGVRRGWRRGARLVRYDVDLGSGSDAAPARIDARPPAWCHAGAGIDAVRAAEHFACTISGYRDRDLEHRRRGWQPHGGGEAGDRGGGVATAAMLRPRAACADSDASRPPFRGSRHRPRRGAVEGEPEAGDAGVSARVPAAARDCVGAGLPSPGSVASRRTSSRSRPRTARAT